MLMIVMNKRITMKNKIAIASIIGALLIFSSFLMKSELQEINRGDFLGTWVNENDNGNQWVFTQDRLTIKHSGSEDAIYTYGISNASSQCGIQVPTSDGETYLSITRIDSPSNTTCFLVNGFAEVTPGQKTLSVSQIQRGGVTLFVKQ